MFDTSSKMTLESSSIEHGGTRPFSNMWYFCEVNLCVTTLWYFCVGLLLAGGFIWFPLHMTMVWYLAKGAGIPAPINASDVCVSKHQSALIGGDGDSSER